MKKVAIIVGGLIILIGGFFMVKNLKEKPKKYSTPMEENDFTIKLIKTVNNSQDSNYLISPYSIEIALNMLRDGSSGSTLEELNKVLPKRKINFVEAKNRIGVANALFLKDVYSNSIEKEYVKSLKDDYQAEVIEDRFITPNKINDWVKNNTYEMIPKILDKIDNDFVLGLANALAVDVSWKNPFECIATEEELFTKTDGKTINVEMMHKTFSEDATYFETKNAKGIILPYLKYDKDGNTTYDEGVELEFVGILPKKDAFTYINQLTVEEFQEMEKNQKMASDKLHIALSLPRFHYDFDLDNFKDVLMVMGIQSVFNPVDADFSNILTKDHLKEMGIDNIFVNTAIHKTYVDFNEKGTKAAAITYFGLFKSSAMMEKPKIINIDFNHSFVYMIRDHETKEVLFFGIVNEPNLWKGTTCSSVE